MITNDDIEPNWFENFAKLIFNIQNPEILPDPIKDNRDIKTNLEVVSQYQGMFVYLLAISENYTSNHCIRLSCKKGKPITKNCYDVTSDSYVINGMDYIKLGEVPYNFKLSLKDSNLFSIDIPVPERLLKRYLSEKQISNLEKFKSHYKNCRFEFIQILKAF